MSLKYVLLTMLSRERQTGYEIVKSFDSAVGYFWSASHQQVYRELSKLTDSELVKFASVEQGDKPDKKVYRITAAGKSELRTWIEKPVTQSPGKDLFLVKLLNINDSNVDVMIAEFDRMLELARSRLAIYKGIEEMHYKRAQVATLALEDLALYLALRKGIIGVKSHIGWLDEARKSITKASRTQSD